MKQTRLITSPDYYVVQDRLNKLFEAYPSMKVIQIIYSTTPISKVEYGTEKQHVQHSVLIIFEDETSTS